nr:sulfurtransferase TusA family protein [uncultured Cohaesibacter sp.]
MQELNLCELKCPLPVLHTQKALAGLAAGALLRIKATDPMAAIDIPHYCSQKGHLIIDSEQKEGILTFTIQKGSAPE